MLKEIVSESFYAGVAALRDPVKGFQCCCADDVQGTMVSDIPIPVVIESECDLQDFGALKLPSGNTVGDLAWPKDDWEQSMVERHATIRRQRRDVERQAADMEIGGVVRAQAAEDQASLALQARAAEMEARLASQAGQASEMAMLRRQAADMEARLEGKQGLAPRGSAPSTVSTISGPAGQGANTRRNRCSSLARIGTAMANFRSRLHSAWKEYQ